MNDMDRWTRVKEVFDAAVACPVRDRPGIVQTLCGDDRSLLNEVESLLAADASKGSMLEQPVNRSVRERVFGAIAGALADGSNALTPGDRLGPYEIAGLLGAGGMGEVYRAYDSTLGRDVALKILPDRWLSDPERRARFDREARVLASLNHPNVGAIYGVQEGAPSDAGRSVKALVLELVEGETLADHIARQAQPPVSRRGLPIDQIVNIAGQVIEALETAHERGIVHRDLKTANIKITPEGRVKVLDFGLARAVAGLGTDPRRPTPSTMGIGDTQDGFLLGTAAYMSPEQARGEAVDKRADIWAFGCVLFEMLTGGPAFAGDTVDAVIANVITAEPDWTALPVDTPATIRLCLRQCLQKPPRQRFHDIGDVRLALEGTFDVRAGDRREHPKRNRTRLAYAGWILALVATGAIATNWLSERRSAMVPARVTRLALGVAPADQLGGREGRPTRAAFALSPDGRLLVFSALRGNRRTLFARPLDDTEAREIPGTEGAIGPFFSPDGKWVGYFVAGKIRRVPVAGGPSLHVADTPLQVGVVGASWGDDDRIVFARPAGLWQVAASGGTPTELIGPDQSRGEVSYRLPCVLPGGDAILFTVTRTRFPRWDQTQVFVYSRRSRRAKPLIDGGADARYVPSGHVVYVREGTLLAAPFDLQRLEVTGRPVGAIADVMQAAYFRAEPDDSGAAQFAVASDGTLVYAPGGVFVPAERSVVRVDRTGRSETLAIPPRAFATMRLSPDGREIALNTFGRDRDIWLHSFARDTTTKLSLPGRLTAPIWSSDGRWIAYAASTAGPDNVYRVPADSGELPEPLVTSEHNLVPGTWTSGGELFYYRVSTAPNSPATMFSQNVALKTAPTPVGSPASGSGGVDLSPDGRWIAYDSAESGQLEVYVQAHPGPGRRYRVSTDGGMSPVWRGDGRELFYGRRVFAIPGQEATAVEMMAVSVNPQPSLTLGTPSVLFSGPYQMNGPARGYDVTSDGQRFLMIRIPVRAPDVITQLNVVQNWTEELKQGVPPW